MTKKTNDNSDYLLTENGWYAYEYPRAAMTADTVIFGFDGEALNVLLVKRGVPPFKGKWALPGGFLRMNETITQCAQRELTEETNFVYSPMSIATLADACLPLPFMHLLLYAKYTEEMMQ